MSDSETRASLTRRQLIGLSLGLPLTLALGTASAEARLSATVKIVPTYEALGLAVSRVDPPVSSGGCALSYRVRGAGEWASALPLWWDSRTSEYRGSIVNLKPQTSYDVRLTHDDGRVLVTSAATWTDVPNLRIKKIIELPASVPGTYVVPEAGNAVDGYVLYRPGHGIAETVISGGKVGLTIAANQKYIILHKIKFTDQIEHCIRIGGDSANADDISDIIVDRCEFTGWGRPPDAFPSCPFARNLSSAVYSYSNRLKRVTIQRCYAHDPYRGANSWSDPNCGGKSRHPEGVQFVTLRNNAGVRGDAGNFVIRWNTVAFTKPAGGAFTDPMQSSVSAGNDAIGDTNNFRASGGIAAYGSPYANSDIYRNVITDVYDEPFEIDGRGENVRIWDNYCDKAYVGVSFAPVGWGPAYFWNNVYQHSRKSNAQPNNHTGFLKYRARTSDAPDQIVGGGKIYFFNNTLLPSFGGKHGWHSLATQFDAGNHYRNLDLRNNVATLSGRAAYSIDDPENDLSNHFIGNLANRPVRHGRNDTHKGWILGVAVYAQADAFSRFNGMTLMGDFRQDRSSPGYGTGVSIPNFLPAGSPDRGAHQRGDGLKTYGHLNMPTDFNPPV